MKSVYFLSVFLGFCIVCAAQQKPVARKNPVNTADIIQAKNYGLLSLLQKDEGARTFILRDAGLTELNKKHHDALDEAIKSCSDVSCFIQHIKFSNEEINQVSNRLQKLYNPQNALGQLVRQNLLPSNKYVLHKGDDEAAFLVKAWQQDAKGINGVLDVYLAGKKPNYPKIDSISFNTQSKAYLNLLYDFTVVLTDETKKSPLFFEPQLTAALHALEVNERNDAANNEPMEEGENKAAVLAIKNTDWRRYPYSVIMVPGAGPEEPCVALSAEAMLRCRLAALRYREGLAPFVMVSGGKVHPYKTPFIEAVEMKIYMMRVLHIPEKALIIEPHARHTTTNMRNAARLIFRYKIPADKPAVVSTTKLQSDAIQKMEGRCLKELGYMPYRLGKLVNGKVLEFYPLKQANQIDADEPMDP